ncbi:MAG: exo-alpha-sialidase [Bacteroidales bacterium]|nr:exo-alpha-sialidase [Bacteroidales bacterium]
MKIFKILLPALILVLLAGCSNNSKKENIQGPYVWKNVTTVGGGFVPGIIFHPTEQGVRYCRTDMGGAYRWNGKAERWEPLLDWLSYDQMNLMGVESIALDPSDPGKVYLACGTYTNSNAPDGAILWSHDRGHTFNIVPVPFKMGGNENGRGNGERMMVDPNNPDILYLGTRKSGLWRSTDEARTWSQVTSFPDVTEKLPEITDRRNRWQAMQNMGSGIVTVIFDPNSKKNGKSQVIYAGVSLMNRENFYLSEDGGDSWEPVPGHPKDFRITHGILAPDGNLYLTYGDNPGPARMRNGACWKFNAQTGEWFDITPDKPEPGTNREFGYAAVSVDAADPQTLVVTTYHRYSAGGDEIFRSKDGGKTWIPVFASGVEFDYSKAPYIHHTGVHWMFDIEIDPNDPDHALFTTGYGGHETFNLTAADRGEKVTWHIMSTGIEETVPLELLSPPEGGQVITAIGDYCGFVHYDLDKPVPEGCFENPHFGNTNGIACAELQPEVIARVGIEAANPSDENIGYSMDGGKTWQPTSSMPLPGVRHGHIAVGSDSKNWIWTPQRSPVFATSDRGETWVRSGGIPENLRVIADRVDPLKFYGLDLFEGKLYISDNGGLSFTGHPLKLPDDIPETRQGRGDSRGGQDRIYATPGRSGDLWLAAFDGLYHTENPQEDFIKLPGVEEIHAFGFGKSAPDSEDPALYLVGTVDEIRGIFRSEDYAGSWLRINDDDHEWGLLMHITGDPKKFGRVYVGTHGRGTIYGDPL